MKNYFFCLCLFLCVFSLVPPLMRDFPNSISSWETEKSSENLNSTFENKLNNFKKNISGFGYDSFFIDGVSFGGQVDSADDSYNSKNISQDAFFKKMAQIEKIAQNYFLVFNIFLTFFCFALFFCLFLVTKKMSRRKAKTERGSGKTSECRLVFF